MLRRWLAAPHSGLQEIAGLTALYGVYEVVRGLGGEDLASALDHTEDIVALEQRLGVFVERGIQDAVGSVAGVPALLGALYVLLHFVGTAVAIVWVHRRHRAAYPVVRTTLIAATALGLVGYVLYPAAPPRLAGLGFVDTVTTSTGLNLSSDLLGSLYNPLAAVPSLHFGYSVIVGATLFRLARSRVVRVAGLLYPALMLFVIVATGNHFFFDAAAGAVTVLAAWVPARTLATPHASRAPRAAAHAA